MSIKQLKSLQEVSEAQKTSALLVFHFMADWAPQCKQMNEVLEELSKQEKLKDVHFYTLLAEDVPEVSLKFDITAVPTFILLRNEKVLDRVDGANAAELTNKVQTQAGKAALIWMPEQPKEDLEKRLGKLISSSKTMLFMKGTPSAPRCGFSRTTIELLNKHNAEYGYFDILSDEEVRQGLKKFSNWPTYPQLYIDGELVGGLDILKEMEASNELGPLLPKKSSLEDRLKSLINRSPLMVFMKGHPSEPRCGFSKQLIQLLKETGLSYDTFDILSDEEVRQGLKKFSNWPTYPQVYVKGSLIGGIDILNELKNDGSLIETLKGE